MKKILVINRDEKTTGALQLVLESEAYKVFIAATMKETVARLNAETFDINDISLADYIQLICMKNATKGIRVSQQNDKGLILIRDGKVMYAAQDNLLGTEAFYRIMSWKKGSFREVKVKLFPPENIDKDYRHLLFEAVGYEGEANRRAFTAPAGISEKVAQGHEKSGDYEVNNKLAKIRAETVADQLRARGIVVNHIASGGEELPVASNLSLAGREKNRRVEVWLR